MNEIMEKWLSEHPEATLREAFTAGWMMCTSEWCHGKREQMERCIELMKEVIA